MPTVLQSFLRCMLALIVWIGAGVAVSSAEPVQTDIVGPRSDLHVRLIGLLGGPEICDDESDLEGEVFCGGDLFADLLVDPSVLKMSRGHCSRLLERLYEQQVCDPGDANCGKVHHGGLPPGPPRDSTAGPGAANLLAALDRGWDPQSAVLRLLRPRNDPPPLSRDIRPTSPPPRASLA